MTIPGIAFLIFVGILLIRVYINHSLKNHFSALQKAGFLWFFSSLPIIFTLFLSKPENQNADIPDQFFGELWEIFSLEEMFVYSAVFLSPVIYIALDLIREIREDNVQLKLEDIKKYLRGFGFLFFSAIALLIITAVTFSAAKIDGSPFSNTYFIIFVGDYAIFIYIFSIFLWYAVILRETIKGSDISKQQSNRSLDFSNAFKKQASFKGEDHD